MKIIGILVAVFLAGCSTIPLQVQQIAFDPNTGEVLRDGSGNPVLLTSRKSQRTLQHEARIALVAQQLEQENDYLGQADYSPGCDISPPPDGAGEAMMLIYYMATMNCGKASGGALSASTVAAIRGEPGTTAGIMFQEMERTERAELKYRNDRANLWLTGILGVANIAKDLHIADISPAGSGGGGGVYVRGDVITNQTASNSRSNAGGAPGLGGEEGVAPPIGDNDQYRLIGQSVFGDVGNGVATAASRQALTGSGPSQQLEPSATGVSTEDSEIKGLVASDEWNQNADYGYDDANDGLSGTLDF